MTYKLLVLELNKTAAVFRTELTTLGIDGYWEAFERDDDGDFVTACRRARAECDYMPTIKQLRMFLPDRRAKAAMAATERYLKREQRDASKLAPWPTDRPERRRRLEPGEPTPVGELVGPYLEPPQ